MIKNKDPKIYSKEAKFYHEDGMSKPYLLYTVIL